MVRENKNGRADLLTFVLQAAQVALLLAVIQAFLIEQTYVRTKLLPVIFLGTASASENLPKHLIRPVALQTLRIIGR